MVAFVQYYGANASSRTIARGPHFRHEPENNAYAMKALKERRAAIAAEIGYLKRLWKSRRATQLAHVDATIQLLDRSIDVDAIPTKRTLMHVKLFKQGELGRHIVRRPAESQSRHTMVSNPDNNIPLMQLALLSP